MSVQLLDKTRKINKLLHNNNSSKVVFNDICAVLTEILDSNVLVVSKKGKILGVSKCDHVREIHELITEAVGLILREKDLVHYLFISRMLPIPLMILFSASMALRLSDLRCFVQ